MKSYSLSFFSEHDLMTLSHKSTFQASTSFLLSVNSTASCLPERPCLAFAKKPSFHHPKQERELCRQTKILVDVFLMIMVILLFNVFPLYYVAALQCGERSVLHFLSAERNPIFRAFVLSLLFFFSSRKTRMMMCT